MPLLKRILHCLEHALVLFAMGMVRLLCGGNILLEVANGVLPRLQALDEEAGDLISYVSYHCTIESKKELEWRWRRRSQLR